MDSWAEFQSPRTDEPTGGLDWAKMQSPLTERDLKRTTREISGASPELYPGPYSGREIDWATYARQGGRPEESGLEQLNAPPSSGALSVGGVVDFPSVQVPESVSEGALRLGGQVAGDVLSGPLGAMGGGMLAEESIANIDRLTGRTPTDPLLRASQGAMGGLETSLIGRGYGLAGKAGGALAPRGLKGAGSLLTEGGAIAGHGLYESGHLTPETAAMATFGPLAARGAGALGRRFSQVGEAAETGPAGGGEGLSHPRIPPEPSSPGGERPPLFKEPAPREAKPAEYKPPEVEAARARFERAMEIPEDLRPRSVGEEYRAMKESREQFPEAGGFSEGGKYRPEIRGGAPKEPPEFTARKVDEGGTEWTVAHADRDELRKAGILKDRGPGMVKTESENPGWYVYKREPGGEWQIVRDAGRATQEGAAIKLMGDAMGLEAPRAPGRPRSESERQLSKEDAETTRRAKEIVEELQGRNTPGEARRVTLPGEPPKPNPELEPVGKYPPPLEEQLKPTKPAKPRKRVKLQEGQGRSVAEIQRDLDKAISSKEMFERTRVDQYSSEADRKLLKGSIDAERRKIVALQDELATRKRAAGEKPPEPGRRAPSNSAQAAEERNRLIPGNVRDNATPADWAVFRDRAAEYRDRFEKMPGAYEYGEMTDFINAASTTHSGGTKGEARFNLKDLDRRAETLERKLAERADTPAKDPEAEWLEYKRRTDMVEQQRKAAQASGDVVAENRAQNAARKLYQENPELGERYIREFQGEAEKLLQGTSYERPAPPPEKPKTPEEELAEAYKARGLKPLDPEKYGREADKILGRGTPEAFEKLESTREERPSLPRAGEEGAKPPKPPRSPVGKEPVQPGEEGFTKGHRKGLESAREMRKAGEKSPVPGHEQRTYSKPEEVKSTVRGFKGKIFSVKFPKNPKKVGDPSEWREMHGTTKPPHDYEFKAEPGSREEVKEKHNLITVFETDEAGSYLRDEAGEYKVRTFQYDKPVTIRGPGGVRIQYAPPAKKVVLPEPERAVLPEEPRRERETSSRISETLSLELPEPEPRRAPRATYELPKGGIEPRRPVKGKPESGQSEGRKRKPADFELPLGKPLEPRERKARVEEFYPEKAPRAEFELPERERLEPRERRQPGELFPVEHAERAEYELPEGRPLERGRRPSPYEATGVKALRKTTRTAASALRRAGEILEFPAQQIDRLTDKLLGRRGGIGARGIWRVLSAVGLAGPATNVGRGLLATQLGGRGLNVLSKRLSRFADDPDLPEKLQQLAKLGDDLPPGEVAARAVIAHWISQHSGR